MLTKEINNYSTPLVMLNGSSCESRLVVCGSGLIVNHDINSEGQNVCQDASPQQIANAYFITTVDTLFVFIVPALITITITPFPFLVLNVDEVKLVNAGWSTLFCPMRTTYVS